MYEFEHLLGDLQRGLVPSTCTKNQDMVWQELNLDDLNPVRDFQFIES